MCHLQLLLVALTCLSGLTIALPAHPTPEDVADYNFPVTVYIPTHTRVLDVDAPTNTPMHSLPTRSVMIADGVSDVVSSTAEARAVPTHSMAPGSATTWNGIPLDQDPNGPDAPSSSFRQDSAISPTPTPVPQINPGTNVTGGFMKNCYSYYFGQYGEQVNKFYALCADDITQDTFHNTYINLDECLVNLNGGLYFADQGIGLDTCNHCQSRKNYTNWLDCWCENDNPGWFNQTSIDLNVGIYYDTYNHVLACFDNMGVLDGPSLEDE